MQFLNKVTVTGADNTVKPEQLLEIAQDYPFVEFAILLSMKVGDNEEVSRFPSKQWIETATDLLNKENVSVAGHLCGEWVRQFMRGYWPDGFYHPDRFKRIQINTHGEPHDIRLVPLVGIVDIMTQHGGVGEVIFQYDNVNTKGFEACHACDLSVSALYDLSHGTGVMPEVWPYPIEGVPFGWAGGLTPQNVAEQIQKIEPKVRPMEYWNVPINVHWIDAETHLRSFKRQNNDERVRDVFDLNKVRQFLEAAKPWVIGESFLP